MAIKYYKTRKSGIVKNKTRKSTKKYHSGGDAKDTFMNIKIIPKGSHILFCSEFYNTIPYGTLPPMKYFWAQLFYPEEGIPTPKNSWFCLHNEKSMLYNTFYVYKIVEDLTLLMEEDFDMFGEYIINQDKSIQNDIRFQRSKKYNKSKPADDYVDVALIYNLFNINGIYRAKSEIILFEPYNTVLEFVEKYGGSKAKRTWNIENSIKKHYFTPSKSVLSKVRTILQNSPIYPKIKDYMFQSKSNSESSLSPSESSEQLRYS